MEQIQLKWSTGNKLEISDNLELPQFSLEKTETKYCTKSYSTGTIISSVSLEYRYRL